MASTPRITNYDEVLGLPGFLEQNLITPENFDSVFSDYQIRDRDMHCCLVSDRGLCNHKHKANSNMRCDSLKSLMIINKLSKFL